LNCVMIGLLSCGGGRRLIFWVEISTQFE